MGGRRDLELGLLRAIGDPALRFSEDYLRMLRAVRFAVTLDFKIEDQTWAALQQYAPQLQYIAIDRIHEELRRSFLQGRSDQALKYLIDSGLLQTFLPEAQFEHWQVPENSLYEKGGDLAAVLAVVLVENSKDFLSTVAERLRCTNTEKSELIKLNKVISSLANYGDLSPATRKRYLREHRPEQLLFLAERLEALRGQLDKIQGDLGSWSPEDLAPPWLLLGKDLMALGLKPGPTLGQWLYELEEMSLNGELNSREECLAEARRRIQQKQA